MKPFLIVWQHKRPNVFTNHHASTLTEARAIAASLLKGPKTAYCIIQGPGLDVNGEYLTP